MAAPRAKVKLSETSRIQRICGIAYALFIILQTPLFTLKLTDTRRGGVYPVPLSPAEVSSLALLNLADGYKPAAQALLVPGAWLKIFTKVVYGCVVRGQAAQWCQPAALWNAPLILQRSDYSSLATAYAKFSTEWQWVLSTGCGVMVVCAISMPVAPRNFMVLLGILILLVGLFLCHSEPLMSAAFCGLLAGTACFGKEKPNPNSSSGPLSSPAAKRATDAATAAAAASPLKGGATRRAKGN